MEQKIAVTAHSAAPASVVFGLLRDVSSWPAWSAMERAELDSPGSDDPLGLGSVRALTKGRVHGFDQVVEFVPNKRFSYLHLRGLPVRDYRGDIDLEQVEGGTHISWQASFRPKYAGTGWFWRAGIRRMLQQMVDGLAAYADEH